MAEEIHRDAVLAPRTLVKDEHHRFAGRKMPQDRVERSPLGKRLQTGAPHPPRDQRVEPLGLKRPADDMEESPVLRELRNPQDGGDLPVAEVAREEKEA